MVQGNATLVMDLGNSSTKMKVLFGKDPKTGKFRERYYELSNVFAPIDEGYEVSADYDDQTSFIIHVDTELNGHRVYGDFCNGDIQQKERPLSVIKPSATSKKYDLDSTVLSVRLALLMGYKAVASIQRVSDLSSLDLTWTIVTLLPPGDYDTGRKPMLDIIRNVTELTSVFPKFETPISIKNVACFPEGFCAYAGCVYDTGMSFREDYKFLKDEYVLIIDIGAGTTDICSVKDNRLVQNSKYTITQGGNNVYQLVRRYLMARGYVIDESDIRRGVITGSIKDGAKVVPITDLVDNAKREIATKIVASIQDFMELTDTNARSIGYVLICGGGSMKQEGEKGSYALSDLVMESFKQLSPNSDIIKIPNHLVSEEDEDGIVHRVERPISPRELNIVGASILAEGV